MTDDAWNAWLRDPVTGRLLDLWEVALAERKKSPVPIPVTYASVAAAATRRLRYEACGRCHRALPCPCTSATSRAPGPLLASPPPPPSHSRDKRKACLGCRRPRRYWGNPDPTSDFCSVCLYGAN